MSKWILGDVSLSETLTDSDHLYPSHINQLRNSSSISAIVDQSGLGQFTDIQEAIDYVYAAGGGDVLIKNGTYTLTDGLLIEDGVSISGETGDGVILSVADNSTFTAHGGQVAVIYKSGDGDITNLSIDANKANNAVQLISGIFLSSCTGNIVDNVNITNAKYMGIYVSGGSYVKVTNCYVKDVDSRGIQFYQSTFGTANFNRVGATGSHGIAFDTNSTYGLAMGNFVTASGEFGISASYDSNYCIFEANDTNNTVLEGLQITSCQGGKIINNHVQGTVSDYGISINTEAGKSTVEHIQITGNTVFQSFKSGIGIHGAYWCSITNNHLYNCVFGGALSNVKNTIHLTETSIYCNVSNNTIIDIKSPITQVYGINEESGCDYNMFTYNIIKGWVTGAVNKTGGNSVLVAGISVTP